MSISFDIPAGQTVLIAGPTASGKSALALALAERMGGVVVNADAIQVYANWRVLTARPSAEDEARAPHRLFGHIAHDQDYSVGHWLREVEAMCQGPDRLIIVGGTGLYFSALTEGLAEIPATPSEIRDEADALRTADRVDHMLADLDPVTRDRIDVQNPMRVQRAWEVWRGTGRSLAEWQDDTPPPLLRLSDCAALLLEADKDWLNARIARRFDQMIEQGALDEVRANLAHWDPSLPSCRAIGAPELVAYLRGEITLDQARDSATISTRQYAKRQRTWFRARMRSWQQVSAAEL